MKDSAEMEAQRKQEAREAKERHDMIYPNGTDQEAQLAVMNFPTNAGRPPVTKSKKKRKSPKP